MKEAGRYLYPLAILCLIVYFLSHVHEILPPFLLAATLSYLVNPLVRRLRRRGVRHNVAVIVVFAGMMAGSAGVMALGLKVFLTRSPAMAAQMLEFQARAEAVINKGIDFVINWQPGQLLALSDWLSGQHEITLLDWGTLHPMEHIAQIAEAFFLVPFLTYFFMLEGSHWWEDALRLAPAGHVEMLLNILMEVEYAFGGYLRGLFLQALFMGGVAGLGFWLMGLMFASRIALWVAMTSMIPFVGPTSAALAGGVVALFQWGTLAGILKVLGVYLAIRLIDDWFFHPFVMRRAVHLHPIVTIFALMAGAFLHGFWGLIFAIPVVCVLKVLLSVTWHYYQVAYGLAIQTSPFDTAVPVI